MTVNHSPGNGAAHPVIVRAAAAAAAAVAAGAEYAFQAQTDLKGVGDYSCNYKEKEAGGAEMPFCFVRGNLNAAADACNDDAGCVAFVTGSRYGVPGAYLKNVVGPASQNSGTSLYLKQSGELQSTYASSGSIMCTTQSECTPHARPCGALQLHRCLPFRKWPTIIAMHMHGHSSNITPRRSVPTQP
jgi:hypothetical protein